MNQANEINDQVAGIRLLAHQALLQILYRSWGAPASELMAALRHAKEVMIADSLPKPVTDLQIHWINHEFSLMETSLQARIDGR
ncbi:hypothetical protein [Lysobacter sp. A289]